MVDVQLYMYMHISYFIVKVILLLCQYCGSKELQQNVTAVCMILDTQNVLVIYM